jgi:hypothetical protein
MGFIFDVAGMTCFPAKDFVTTTLAVMNSRLAKFILSAINPTINYQVGDIERLPIPKGRSPRIEDLVERCVELTKLYARESEVTYDFIVPLLRIEDRKARKAQLEVWEAEIDSEVSRLYGLRDEDRPAIDRELSGSTVGEPSDIDSNEGTNAGEDDETRVDFSPGDLGRSWISYAIGAVLGRFEIGKSGGLGCGDFPKSEVREICKLIDPDGIMPCDVGHARDIAGRVVKCLNLMLGVKDAGTAIFSATGYSGDFGEAVRSWLDRFTGGPEQSFWKYHVQAYRKRPVYWPLQSPRKEYTVWVFHEKFDKNTLFTVRKMVEERLRLLDREISDKRKLAGTNRRLANEIDKLLDVADDLREFSKRIKETSDRGYAPHFDDGVLLNAAPLYPLLPSWAETEAAWEELEAGEYDWAQQAMEYWPVRVKAACKTNKSFAIAHGLA